MTAATETTPLSPPFPDCEHKAWTLGCERCFWEMERYAKAEVRAHSYDDQLQGAILFNWHIVMVLKDMEDQLAPLTRSLDLKQVELAKTLIANLKQLGIYFVNLVADPMKLNAAMRQAAEVALEMQRALAAQKAGGPRPEALQPPLITLTD